MSIRPTLETRAAVATMEGAGVKLHRAFGFHDPSELDPFLLFDDFRNDSPADFEKGFPWHPHRGIETITYVLDGSVAHADSLGNTGYLNAGDVQWMTAGSGILHQEMPRGNANGQMHGFQLWANLPGSMKMTTPRYQDVEGKEIPTVVDDDGTSVRVIIGISGVRKARLMGLRQTRNTSISLSLPGCAKRSKSTHTAAPLLTFLRVQVISLMRLHRPAYCWKKRSWAKRSTSAICPATAL